MEEIDSETFYEIKIDNFFLFKNILLRSMIEIL